MLPIPPATLNLILACVAVFFLGTFQMPAAVLQWCALWPLGSGAFMPWQLVTYAFMHGGTAHLLFNLLFLWMFGSELERLWGRSRYLWFLLASAAAAAVAQLIVTTAMGSTHPTVGASGAVYGLLLAYALAFPYRQFDLIGFVPMLMLMLPSPTLNLLGALLYVMLMTNRQAVPVPPVMVRAGVMVGILIGIELLFGLFVHTGVAHFAHLGGMAGGWLMLKYWRGHRSRRR